jgi:hypothetical protein
MVVVCCSNFQLIVVLCDVAVCVREMMTNLFALKTNNNELLLSFNHRHSGFGRLGAWLSLQPFHSRDHIYSVLDGQDRLCGVEDFDAYEQMALNV